ncbi:MAG TPA: P-loop NTPase fold protein, partial [Nitrososphaeraceae archaeon]|nr:P-loop NTPase fold protein [Nitrososphaeraceae archaeon]
MFSIESVKLWFKTRRKNTANQQNRNDVIYNKPLNDISSNLKTACPKIITDEPSLNYDAFDFKTYSEKLVHIILNSKPRFAIGIFGGWGTGKTTLMKMIEAKLNGYVFCWENIPTSEKDNHNLKKYIKKNFSNVDWIEQKEFIKSPDNKKISIYNNKDSISISLNENTNTVSLTINNEILNKELIVKKENNRSNIYEKQNDILTVWFDAWKYEKEKHLAILPFIRTIQIELEHKLANESTATNDYTITQLHKKWAKVRKGLEKTFNAFLESTNLNFELGKFVSTDTKLSTFKDVLKSESSPFEIDGERIFYYHKHISEHLIDAINNLRNTKLGGNPNNRIVVFIDDLDRCSPDKAIEVLESLKTFFDIEGFVYVIGMDSKSINAIVRKKYGNDSHIEGLEYMEKIVQLPFRIPTWKRGWTEEAISKSIIQIVSTELNDSELISEFDKNKELIAKAIQSNPRQLKRFINNVIFTKTVFNDRDIDKLIVVQALDFHQEWSNFLDLITPNQKRKAFFEHYIKLK